MKNKKLPLLNSLHKLQAFFKIGIFLFFLFTFLQSPAQGTWTALINPAPISAGGGAVLLTDGTVMCKGYKAASGFPGNPDSTWMLLTPDIHGSYIHGTWSVLHQANYSRSVFASQVLPNGDVYVGGGEHGSGGSSAELYNTKTNSWTNLPNIPGYGIYDGNSELLYDGTVIQGCALIWNPDTTILIYNPAAGNLRAGPATVGSQEETSWLKLPDSSILYVNTITTTSERYIPQQHRWVADANVPVQLYDPSSEETGPATLLPNGKGFFIGDVGYTAFYTPSGNASPGTWTTGPNEPIESSVQLGSWDGPCAMMVNGHVLYSISALASESLPSFFYEYDYVSNTFTRVGVPGGYGDSVETQTNMMTMLDLPDGNVLFAYTDSTKFYIYTPAGSPIAQGIPTIDGVVADSCNKWMITGKLFNGISEGAAFGDDWQMSTNYPIIRVTNGTNVYYAKTYSWNRRGAVQTGSAEDTAYFTFPNAIPGGTYSLVLTANGFPSSPVSFTTFGISIVSQTNITGCGTLGSVTVSAGNGAPPYSYSWAPGGGTNAYDSNLTAGTYTVTVTEVGGCAISKIITITQPPVLSITSNVSEISCRGGNNGSAHVTPSGGTLPYTYSWSNGGTTSSITGLTAGTYSISVFDSCGYSQTASVTITQPGVLKTTVSTTNLKCYGYSNAQVRVTGDSGTAPYTYLWQNGATTSTTSGLSRGTYSVVVHDLCGGSATASITVTAPPALTGTIDSVNSSSGGICDGKAWVSLAGGTPPYTYLWTTGGQTTDTIKGQCPGNYCCVVTDNSGCDYSLCVDINVTGIAKITSGNEVVSLYPNPNYGVFTIALSHTELFSESQPIVKIYNVLGENVLTEALRSDQAENLINLTNQPNGVYFYRVLSGNEALIGDGKLIIEK